MSIDTPILTVCERTGKSQRRILAGKVLKVRNRPDWLLLSLMFVSIATAELLPVLWTHWRMEEIRKLWRDLYQLGSLITIPNSCPVLRRVLVDVDKSRPSNNEHKPASMPVSSLDTLVRGRRGYRRSDHSGLLYHHYHPGATCRSQASLRLQIAGRLIWFWPQDEHDNGDLPSKMDVEDLQGQQNKQGQNGQNVEDEGYLPSDLNGELTLGKSSLGHVALSTSSCSSGLRAAKTKKSQETRRTRPYERTPTSR